MIRHLLRLLWHRKRANSLLIAEMFISFLVLFAVVTATVFFWSNYHKPLGFSFENIWIVSIDMKQAHDDIWNPEMLENCRLVNQTLNSLPEVEAVGGMQNPPYGLSTWIHTDKRNGKEIQWQVGEGSDKLNKVFGLNLVAGRWFNETDNASNYRPTVINRRLAQDFFGAEDPIGKLMSKDEERGDLKVIGVIDDFRKGGEFAGEEGYAFTRINWNDTLQRPPQSFILKVRPQTPGSMQQTIAENLHNVVKSWSFEVQPLTDMRRLNFKAYLGALLAGGLIVGNLILMVALGLIGVLWQNVTRRRSEIGLRRAMGAAASHVYHQILIELLIIASFGILLGVVIVIQFPLLGVFGSISWAVYLSALAFSLLFMYGVVLLAALYPSRIAMRIQPIEALHYE